MVLLMPNSAQSECLEACLKSEECHGFRFRVPGCIESHATDGMHEVNS